MREGIIPFDLAHHPFSLNRPHWEVDQGVVTLGAGPGTLEVVAKDICFPTERSPWSSGLKPKPTGLKL